MPARLGNFTSALLGKLKSAFTGDVAATALHAEQDVKDSAIFLCGGENLVKRLKRDFFMRGVSMKDIRSDAFTPSG